MKVLFLGFLLINFNLSDSFMLSRRRRAPQPTPKDCVLSNWKTIAACSEKCGPFGVETQERDIVTEASNGGKPCSDYETKRVVECNRVCYNDGQVNTTDGRCDCAAGFTGECCGGVVDSCSGVNAKLQDAEKKVAQAENKIGSLEIDVDKYQKFLKEAEKKAGNLESDLEGANDMIIGLKDILEKAQKETCPGKGIWTVPEYLVGKKITSKLIKNWRKNGKKNNLSYLGSLVNVKMTEKLATYVECFMTVN